MEISAGKSKALFYVLFSFLLINLLSITVFNSSIPLLRFVRQPALLVYLAALFHFFPSHKKYEKQLMFLRRLFYFYIFYLVFNVLTSLDKGNSISYGIWLIGLFTFLFHQLILRNDNSFQSTLKTLATAGALLGSLILIASYLGGYVFNIESFFDERYNYTIGIMKTEFAGIYGSNNSLGMCAFYTAAFFLILTRFDFQPWKKLAFWGLVVLASGLVFQIGNRASMACILVLLFFYFVWVKSSAIGLIGLATAFVVFGTIYQEELTEKLRLEQFEGGNILGNRSELIGEALEITQNMDFFGVGYQNQRLSRKYFRLVSENDKEYNFHNTYLAVIAELGWLGLLWVPGLIIYGIFFFRNGSVQAKSDQTTIRLIASILLTVCLIHLPVEDSVNSPGSPFFLWFWSLFFILLLGKCQNDESDAEASSVS